mmetsp:Transcript_23460/g.35678  ORF Transcript_23460/g.35678 Transcript_23460/m.35678 type:complete len:103 (-) Transcript_23460:12-320(-)
MEAYMKHQKEINWNEEEERDPVDFLELEKEIYLEKFPNNEVMFDKTGEDFENENEVQVQRVRTKKSTRKLVRKADGSVLVADLKLKQENLELEEQMEGMKFR